LFECDWFDVPDASKSNKSKSKGYSKDQYGIIDIETSRRRYIWMSLTFWGLKWNRFFMSNVHINLARAVLLE
jgi:hypothetical protein